MIKFNESCHWYDKLGQPQHDADLRVARKQLLHASVTTIDKAEFKNEFLEKWKLNQYAIAAADNPRQAHESAEDYANRLYELSNQYSEKASLFGKAVHAAIEDYPQLPLESSVAPYVEHFGKWYDANFTDRMLSEHIMVDPDIGVAGMGDFKGIHKSLGLVWVDWKTQNVKKDDKGRKRPMYYDSWLRQLSFYSVCDAKMSGTFPNFATCISVVIDSNEPCEPFIKVWDKDETKSAYEDFVIAAYRWHKKRNYWPLGPWTITANVPMPE